MKITQHLAIIPPKPHELIFISMGYTHGYSYHTPSGSVFCEAVNTSNNMQNNTD